MRVKAQRSSLNAVMAEEFGRVPGVFGGHEVRFAQDPQRPECDVLEVADGRGDHGQQTRHRTERERAYCTIA